MIKRLANRNSKQQTDRNMQRTERAANLILLSPIFAAIVITCLLATPLSIVFAFFCYAIGLLSLFHAKLSLFRRCVWISFGPSRLAPEYRRSYWAGYAFIAVGALPNIVALFVIGRLGHGI